MRDMAGVFYWLASIILILGIVIGVGVAGIMMGKTALWVSALIILVGFIVSFIVLLKVMD